MHLLNPTGGVALTPGVDLKIVTPNVSQNHLSFFDAIKIIFPFSTP
jgi:hypothetical protein